MPGQVIVFKILYFIFLISFLLTLARWRIQLFKAAETGTQYVGTEEKKLLKLEVTTLSWLVTITTYYIRF